VLLNLTADYVETNSTTVTLTTGATAGDVLTFITPVGVWVSTTSVPASIVTLTPSTYNSGTSVQTALTNVGSATGATNVGYTASGAGAVPRTVASKQGESVSVLDFGADPTGGTDSTLAIQAAIAASKQIYFPIGTYLCSAITFNTAGLSGVAMKGQSSTKTIFKPTASATNFLTVEGGFNQYNTFENFTIDMSLMSNANTSRGIYMTQTWGNSIRNVNVINYGSSAYTLYLDVGVYTSVFDNCNFGSSTGVITVQGVSLSNAVTTCTFIGCSFGQAILNNVVAMTFLQPIVQGTLNKFVLSNTSGVSILNGDIEGSGTYLNIGSSVNDLCSSNNTLSGFTGTYSSGTLLSGYLMDIYGSNPFNFAPVAGTTHKGVITETSAVSGLVRKVISNTSGVASSVDIQTLNSTGSTYAGMNTSGDYYIDNRGSGKTTMQQSGTDRLGITSAGVLLVGTTTASSATAGSNGAPPAQVAGYINVSIGGTNYKIPYYAN
jgi:hypothetical protein